MNTTTTETRIRAEFWAGDAYEGATAFVEVERDDEPGRVALHTFVDGQGSVTSYVWDREAAISLARALLAAVELRGGE